VGRVGVLALAVAAAAALAAVALAAQSPEALRASILGAAKAQHSVHYATREVLGNLRLTLTGDVAVTAGRQHVVFEVGTQTGHITIRVLARTAYVQGDANGLQLLQQLTKAQASKYAGRWISIPKGDEAYSRTAAEVTLGTFLQSITPRGRLATFKGKEHGTRVIGVRAISGTGKKKKLQVLVARAKGKRLPLGENEAVPGRDFIGRTTMSKWNESVRVQAPAQSVPISTVVG
jgi:hypothetical protein